MLFLKGYKKLYEIEKEKNSELRRENDALREKAEKEIIPFSLKVYFDVEDVEERYIIFENVIEYKTNYTSVFPPIPENWIIKTADGLTSVIDYKKVVCIVACKKLKNIQGDKNIGVDIAKAIDNAIITTNSDDEYSRGMRNGMRYVKSLFDGKAPEYD